MIYYQVSRNDKLLKGKESNKCAWREESQVLTRHSFRTDKYFCHVRRDPASETYFGHRKRDCQMDHTTIAEI